ncbi:MAG: hypothetical protein NZ455_13240 [Bacteroidia bacterium]|nr:hypothetical protein [Bacteroidia bacterium]MDW8346988.1 hypothetical protein [Bacteroidia bacterium]
MRSAAKHRSDSAARSTPTRAQRGTRPKNIFYMQNDICIGFKVCVKNPSYCYEYLLLIHYLVS